MNIIVRMSNSRKYVPLIGNLLVILIGIELLFGIFGVFTGSKAQEEEGFRGILEGEISTIEGNSVVAVSSPLKPENQTPKKLRVVVTAYSSTPWETDGNPYVTASGNWVREGVVANNLLSFGTKVKIPEIFGDKVFVVEDRMNWKKGKYHVDIWLPSYEQALIFGAKRAYIEILEN